MPELSRRTFLALGATAVAGACSGGPQTAPSVAPPSTRARAPASTSTSTPATDFTLSADPFTLGVTSGDPDEHSAVLWTRVTGAGLADSVDVEWEVATDEAFAAVTAGGRVAATLADGHSVHVTAELAAPSWYRFRAGGFTSPVGRVAPVPTVAADPLRIAATSCQHFETGYYAAYRDLAGWAPHLVLFLGDFIYEAAGQPVGGDRVRSHDAPEATDLAGYRARYAQYLSDPDLRTARAACPWLVIWDDHEVENNYAGLSPTDPADAPGFAARRAAAYRAWWEHMPVRLPAPSEGAAYEVHRRLDWGGLADLILLDGRQYRSDQACGDVPLSVDPPCPEASDPARTMLGEEQERWLGETIAGSTATWCVLGQQTVLTDLRLPNGAVLNYDQWDGYAPARERVLAQLAGAERAIVLTGDIHLAGVGRLPDVGVEFVTTSISSLGDIDAALEPVLVGFDTVVAAELSHRGYTRHTVTPDLWTAEYRTVDDVRDPASPTSTWRTFRVEATARDLPIAE